MRDQSTAMERERSACAQAARWRSLVQQFMRERQEVEAACAQVLRACTTTLPHPKKEIA